MTAPAIDAAVEQQVREAFAELDCCSKAKAELPCGGPLSGFVIEHDCTEGWLCKNHWDRAQAVHQKNKSILADCGYIRCELCLNKFGDIRKYQRLFPMTKEKKL